MTRSVLLALCLAACGGKHHSTPPMTQQAAKGHDIVEAPCPRDAGCELEISETPRFEPPDELHEAETVQAIVNAKRPEATCAAVGLALASLELGNYADDETRVPVVARHVERCTKLKLDAAERTCVFEARDKPTMAYCAPRLVPDVLVQLVEARYCGDISRQIRARMATLNAPPKQAIWEARIDALEQSCRQDRWTIRFGECAKTSVMAGTPTPCLYVAPQPLRIKIEDRLAKLQLRKP